MAKNRIKLNICGCECALCSDDSENYMRSIGDEVQKAIDGVMDKNERVSVTLASIITALSYCDECHKEQSSAENLRTQIKNYLEDSSHARLEAEEAKRELERLKRENQTLRARLAALDSPAEEEKKKKPPLAPAPPPKQQTGDFSRVPPEAQADQESFMSFFEKKTNEP